MFCRFSTFQVIPCRNCPYIARLAEARLLAENVKQTVDNRVQTKIYHQFNAASLSKKMSCHSSLVPLK
jgi:hypothetical protein